MRRYLRFWRADVRTDVDDELRFHLDERIAELSARGLAPAAAHDQAHAEFGDVEAVRGRLRAIGERRQRRQQWHERASVIASDAAYAVRSLTRAPALVATIVLTLALGLGANGAIFSLVDRIFFRPPAGVADPDGVRRLYVTQHGRTADGKPLTRAVVNYPEFLDLRAGTGPNAGLVAYAEDDAKLGTGEDAPTLSAVYAGEGYFGLLGVRPALGRFFGGDETRVDTDAPVVVLSDAFWRRQFGGDRGVLGRTLPIGRQRVTIVGVAPRGFAGTDLDAIDLWRPLGTFPGGRFGVRAWHQSRMMYVFRVLARPAPQADERQMAARAPAPYADQHLLDQSRGVLVRKSRGARSGAARLHRRNERRPEAVRLDEERRRDPGLGRPILSPHFRRAPLAPTRARSRRLEAYEREPQSPTAMTISS